MKLPWPFNLIEKFAHFLTNIPNILLSGAGGLILALSLVAGAVIERKDVAVAVAIAGTFVGTALLSFFFPKLLYTMKEKELKQAAEDALVKDRLAEEERKTRENERRLAEAKQAIARLEAMHINVDAFRSVLKLGLLDIKMKITHFDRISVGFKEGSWLRKDQEHVYVGVLELPIRALLGVDLEKVRLRNEGNGSLVVSNITFSRIVSTPEMPKRPLEEVRTEFQKNGKVVEVQADPTDSRLLEQTRAHETRVRERLNTGQDFECYEGGIKKAAEQALRLLLSPMAKDIIFSEEFDGEGEEILQFLMKHNERLQIEIQKEREV